MIINILDDTLYFIKVMSYLIYWDLARCIKKEIRRFKG